MLRLRQRNGTGNRKRAIFLFNWSSQYHIYIVKYLYTSRDDWFENLGEIAVLACEMITSGFRPRLAQGVSNHSVLMTLSIQEMNAAQAQILGSNLP